MNKTVRIHRLILLGQKGVVYRNIFENSKNKLFIKNKEDKFMLKNLDELVNDLLLIFKDYSKDFIIDALKGNSMDIEQTYYFLKDPNPSNYFNNVFIDRIFTELDDEILKNMKDTELYKNLVTRKGQGKIQERIDFLNLS